MPSFQMDQPPVVAARGDAEALRQYIVLLVDRLKYVLNHLDDENIQSVSATKIGRRMGTMADALGEKGTDNERVRQMVRELTMTTFKSADIDWNQMKGFDRAVETAVQVIMEALRDGIDNLSDRVDDIEAALEALQAMTEEEIDAILGDLDGEISRVEDLLRTYRLRQNTLYDDLGENRGQVDFSAVNARIDTVQDTLAENTQVLTNEELEAMLK